MPQHTHEGQISPGFPFSLPELPQCVAHQLGVDDKFNLCSLGKGTSDAIIWEIVDTLLLPDVFDPPAAFDSMAGAYMDGLNSALPVNILSIKSTLACGFWALKKPQFMPKLGAADSVRYWLLRLLLGMIAYAPLFEAAASWMVVRAVGAAPVTGGAGGEEHCPQAAAARAAGAAECPHPRSRSSPRRARAAGGGGRAALPGDQAAFDVKGAAAGIVLLQLAYVVAAGFLLSVVANIARSSAACALFQSQR
jgi:hypothetical protein